MRKAMLLALCVMTVFGMSTDSYAVEMMKKGTRGNEVREVQETLISLGYLEEGDADGVFGPRTEKAVLAFQQDRGLDASGMVGEGTLRALTEDSPNGGSGTEEAAEASAVTEDPASGQAESEEAPKETAAGEVQSAEVPDEDASAGKVFPSWDPDSASLRELVDYVSAATEENGPDYLDPADRIAVFDMDGTILCEKAPVYFDYCLTLHRVLDDPTYDATEEERDAMQQVRDHAYAYGETFKPEGITKHDLVSLAFAGMTPEEFRSYVADYADNTEAVGFAGMTYGQSFYKPMIEVIDYLRDNEFDVWMVSACEREIVRALVERFDIQPDHVIATDVPYIASGKGEEERADDYNMGREETMLLGAPLDEVECGKSGKPAAIAREIGKRPVLAFGNSSGDYSMLNYAEGNPEHTGMGFLVVCDDTEREYGSEEKAAEYYEKAEEQGWTAISMAEDWETIYGDGVEKTGLPGGEEIAAEAA